MSTFAVDLQQLTCAQNREVPVWKINILFQVLQLLPFFITREGQRKTKTTAEVVLRSALEPHVCSHLNVAVAVELSLLNSSPDSLAHEIHLRQYCKEFMGTSPDDRAADEVLSGRAARVRRTNTQRLQPALSLCLTNAERIAFLSRFQFGFSDNCGGQAAFGRWLRARDAASPSRSSQKRLQAVTSDPRTTTSQNTGF